MDLVFCQVSGQVKRQQAALRGILRVLRCKKGSASGNPSILEVGERNLHRTEKACPAGEFITDVDIDLEFKLRRIVDLARVHEACERKDLIPARWRLRHEGRVKPSKCSSAVCWFKASDMPITANASTFLHSMGFRIPAIKASTKPAKSSPECVWTVIRWFARVGEAAASRRVVTAASRRMVIAAITDCDREITELGRGVVVSLRFPKTEATVDTKAVTPKMGRVELALDAAAKAAEAGLLTFRMTMCGQLADKDKNCEFLLRIMRPYQEFVEAAVVSSLT